MKVSIEWKYKTRNNKELTLTSGFISLEDALLISEDFEKTGRMKQLLFYDEQYTSWTKKELSKLIKEVETEPHDVIAYFDGGFHAGMNKAGLGVAIYYTQNNQSFRMRVNDQFEELDTNNEAEYAAFWFLLNQLQELGVHHMQVTFRGDSHVVLNQLSGDWPCTEKSLNRWLDRIEAKMNKLGIRPIYEPISRKENNEADKLATQALKNVFVSSKKKLTT